MSATEEKFIAFCKEQLGVELEPWQITFIEAVLSKRGEHSETKSLKVPVMGPIPWPNGFRYEEPTVNGGRESVFTEDDAGCERDITDEYEAWLKTLPTVRHLTIRIEENPA